jgi:serine/threonine protein kinase
MCTDTRDGSTKFLKKFLSPKMPSEDERMRDRGAYDAQVAGCNAFRNHHEAIMRDLNEERIGNGSLVKPHDAFWHESSFFKVSPFIPDLDEFSSERVRLWPAKSRVLAIRGVLLALRELHDRSIVHGDIKRENIHLVEMPTGLVARLIDFDDAYRADSPPPPTVLGGTEDYYSPEVLIHKGFVSSKRLFPLGLASDLFSLSLVFHEVFSSKGKRPRWHGPESTDAGLHALAGDDVEYDYLGTGQPLLEYRLKRCLLPNPQHRPRLSELLSACGTNLGRIA